MNNRFEDRLRDSLAEQSSQIEIEGAGPNAAAVRAGERAQRSSIVRGLASLVVLFGLGAAAYTQFGGQDDQLIAAEQTTTTVSGSAEETANAVESASIGDFDGAMLDGPGFYFGRFLTDEGQLIQLTTKPGVKWEDLDGKSPPYIVVVSDRTGVVQTNELPEDLTARTFAYHGGVLFSVSTSPKSPAGGEVIVNRSSDLGKSWSATTIDTGWGPKGEHVGMWQNTSIAANTSGVLVSVETSYFLNFETLLPQYAYSPESETYFDMRPTDTGVEVRDWEEHSRLSEERYAQCGSPDATNGEPSQEEWEAYEQCWAGIEELPEPDPIAVYTWDELGVEPVPSESEAKLFYSSDGAQFEAVTAPVEGISPYIMSNDETFLLQAYQMRQLEPAHDGSEGDWQPRWFSSDDGRNWQQLSPPPGECGITPGGGGAFISHSCDSIQRFHRSLDGGHTWTPLAPMPATAPDGYVNYYSVYTGKLGLVAVSNTEPDYMLLEQALMEGSDQNLGSDEMEAIERRFNEDNARRVELFFSVDGSSWASLETPVDLDGASAWVNDVIVGAGEIVVSYGIENPGVSFTTKTVFLTPS